MAQTLETIRGLARTTIHGRRLGIGHDEFLVGVKDIRKVVTEATSDTTGTNLPNHGLVSVVTTTDDGWTLTDPEIGVSVRIATGTTSTGVHTITGAAATIVSSEQSTMGVISIVGGGGMSVELMGLTTAKWLVTARSSTGGVLFTTA